MTVNRHNVAMECKVYTQDMHILCAHKPQNYVETQSIHVTILPHMCHNDN